MGTKAVMKQAAAQKWTGHNRRRDTRTAVPSGPAGARLLGGIDVTLHNVSRRGMLFESSVRLLVGSPARLRLRSGEGWTELTGRVVRCEVTGIGDARIRYATALHLDSDCAVEELSLLIGVPSEGQLAMLEARGPIDPTMN
jgi:hypothetical protein